MEYGFHGRYCVVDEVFVFYFEVVGVVLVLLSLEYAGYPLSYTPCIGIAYGVWYNFSVFYPSFWVYS